MLLVKLNVSLLWFSIFWGVTSITRQFAHISKNKTHKMLVNLMCCHLICVQSCALVHVVWHCVLTPMHAVLIISILQTVWLVHRRAEALSVHESGSSWFCEVTFNDSQQERQVASFRGKNGPPALTLTLPSTIRISQMDIYLRYCIFETCLFWKGKFR